MLPSRRRVLLENGLPILILLLVLVSAAIFILSSDGACTRPMVMRWQRIPCVLEYVFTQDR